ncbi:MAG: hypothetical protein RSA57_03740 [Cetobacterium sp.]|uniref:hypothetical protein n=1 Tax=Bacteria TaxID=2 RepID=UPI002FC72611
MSRNDKEKSMYEFILEESFVSKERLSVYMESKDRAKIKKYSHKMKISESRLAYEILKKFIADAEKLEEELEPTETMEVVIEENKVSIVEGGS